MTVKARGICMMENKLYYGYFTVYMLMSKINHVEKHLS